MHMASSFESVPRKDLLQQITCTLCWGRGFPGGPEVENPPAEQESRVQSLAREDPPEKGMVTHSSVCLENSVSRGGWQARVHEVAKRWTRLSH